MPFADRGDVRDPDHQSAAAADRRLGQLLDVADPGVGADHIGLAGAGDVAGAGNAIGVLERVDQLTEADAVGGQARRIRTDGIFLHIAALDVDRRDALHAPQLRRDDPVLHGPQIGRLAPPRSSGARLPAST